MDQKAQKKDLTFADPDNSVLYFLPDYLATQQYSDLTVIKTDHCIVCFSIEGGTAKSLPRSPFGGIFLKSKNQLDFNRFHAQLEKELKEHGVEEIIINQPPHYYGNFAPTEWLISEGYKASVEETNQYIPIENNYFDKLHRMEKAKLKNKSNFIIQRSKAESADEIHGFIAKCRKGKGLAINIPIEKFRKLIQLFPDRYEIFEARKGDKLAAAAVMALPVQKIAYYYLPATNPEFKNLSPMVSLMDYIYNYYRIKDYNFIDLGLSSINGTLQGSLFKFKKRMGAMATPKTTFKKKI